MAHIVVVANQTIAGAKLLDLVRERAQAPDTSFTLVVPMTKPRSGYVIYDDAVRDSAQVRLDLTLSYLRGEGVVANGELGDEDPFTATLDAVDEYHPDEVIISTLPHSSSGWLRRDLIERIQDAARAPSPTSSPTWTPTGSPSRSRSSSPTSRPAAATCARA